MIFSLLLGGIISLVLVASSPLDQSLSLLHPRAACSGNTASDRSVWCNYDINTDYTFEVPDTGVTREYYFELNDVTISPDGYSLPGMTINGQVPGPTIIADWGDTVVVHVTNNLTLSKSGTSIHFHGIRQNFTNQNDGVTSITQCPTAPGESMTYTWRATQYGTAWYHSHFALQAGKGIFGGIIINGPATSNYDEDKGVLFLNDWGHKSLEELYHSVEENGPPIIDNGLINGTNVFGPDGSGNQTGRRFTTNFVAGTTYRLRLINAAVNTHFKFSIDGHSLTVIANDLVPIKPFTTNVLNVGMAQRYDVLVKADRSQYGQNFWMRAVPQSPCSKNANPSNIKGIVYYGSSPSTPKTSAYSYVDACDDEDPSDLVPYLPMNVSPDHRDAKEMVTLGRNSENLYRWYLNGTSMAVKWDDPTLLQVYKGNKVFANSSSVIKLPEANQWVYVILETDADIAHPIHLHGHDYFILAAGAGKYDPNSIPVNLSNPPRRDTAMLQESGYLVVAFLTDNPGAWLMHCHIAWHLSQGFSLQFIERQSEIPGLINYDSLNSNCKSWSSFAGNNSLVADDSGV